MSTLLFDRQGSFHFQEVRSALVRIPEVIQKIREVQKLLDEKGEQLDLANFMVAEDSLFLHHYRKKEFAGIVFQLGLYDRYLKTCSKPKNIVGVANSISAVRVISGQMSLKDLVDEAFRHARAKESDTLPGLPILTGIQIPKYQQYSMNEEAVFTPSCLERADLQGILNQVAADDEVLEVGLSSDIHSGTVEKDPHLSWVWGEVSRRNEYSSAAN